MIPRVQPEEIAQRGKFEMITVLFPLAGRPADLVAKEIEPLLGEYGKCVGLTQTGQLLVTETAGKLQAISILIASIPIPQQPKPPAPKPDPPPPVLAVYPVTTIDPAAAVETLKVLFPKAELKIDDKADQIMAYATPNEQAAIKAAIDQMQANRPPENAPRLEIYPLDLPATADPVKQLQTVLPKIQATFDASLGRLLVFAEPKDQEQVKAIIQQLGTIADGGGKQVVVYQPKHFDPTALATLVKQLLPRVEISSDAKLRRVVVSTSPGNQAMVKSLVDQLDQESALEDKPLLQTYPLGKPFSPSLLATLSALVPSATVSVSTDTKQLIVVAKPEDQAVIKQTLDQISVSADTANKRKLELYQVDGVTAAQLQTLLQTLVVESTITVDTPQDRLIIWGPENEHLAFAEVISKLKADRGGKQVVVYQPQRFDPTALSTLVKQLIPRVEMSLDAKLRRVVVSASSSDQAMVKSLVDQLDQESALEDKPQLQLYPLDKRLDETLLTTLRPLIPEAQLTLSADGRQLTAVARVVDQTVIKKLVDQWQELAAAREEPTLKIYTLEVTLAAADVATLKSLVPAAEATLSTDGRQLRVVARAADHTQIEVLIKELEQAATAESKPGLQIYPLGKPLNPTLLATLSALVPTAKVSVSADTKQLIVVAQPEDQAVIKKTLDQISVSADTAKKLKLELYQVEGVTAAQLQTLLQTLVVESTITVDTPQDRLIIWGPENEHLAFADVIEKAQSGSAGGNQAGSAVLSIE